MACPHFTKVERRDGSNRSPLTIKSTTPQICGVRTLTRDDCWKMLLRFIYFKPKVDANWPFRWVGFWTWILNQGSHARWRIDLVQNHTRGWWYGEAICLVGAPVEMDELVWLVLGCRVGIVVMVLTNKWYAQCVIVFVQCLHNLAMLGNWWPNQFTQMIMLQKLELCLKLVRSNANWVT